MNPANLDAALDAWITGDYGEDHPDNQQHRAAVEADRDYYLRKEADDRDLYYARRDSWQWIAHNCNGIHNIGACPICGERIQVLGSKITDNGRLIGSCGDAFTVEQWEE